MKIKQVEELVGVTSKNIRFYEDQGLLSPNRAENGYREYGLEDIKTLKQIKLLRKLGISIEEIKAVFHGKESLTDCLEKNLDLLERQQKDLEQMKLLANQLLEEKIALSSLDTDAWLEQMESLEKEGVRFMDVNKIDIHRKKKAGALVGGFVMIGFFVAMIALMIWAEIEDPSMPIGILIGAIVMFGGIIVAILVVMISRVKEIEGGEEDEALKY